MVQYDYADVDDTSFLHLNLNTNTTAKVTNTSSHTFTASVGPVVLFSILDHYVRRPNDDEHRVIGALLGVRTGEAEGEVEIRNCFPLAHTETEENISIDPDYLQEIYNLHQRVNSKEVIVGWYATGSSIDALSVDIHEHFAADTFPYQPVHLLIDTRMTQDKLSIQTWVTSKVGVPKAEYDGSMFIKIPCDVKYQDTERSGLDLISTAKEQATGATLMSDMDSLERSIVLIQGMLETIGEYVAKVKSGEIKANNAVGRFLMDAISAVPRINTADFEKMFNNHLQLIESMKKPKERKYRKRETEEDDEAGDADAATPDADIKDVVLEALEMRKIRKRPAGVATTDLIKGDSKAPPKPEAPPADPWKLKSGGLVDLDEVKGVKMSFGGAEDATQGPSSKAFVGGSNAMDTDRKMHEFIEKELKKKRGDEGNGQREDEDGRRPLGEDELFHIPDHLQISNKNLQEGNVTLSASMLTAIPEVDLGIKTKLKNIEATEKAKRELLYSKKKNTKADDVRITIGLINPVDQTSDADHRNKERGGDGGKRDRRNMATDDLVMERFKKRTRR
ncbi:hypothetical protein HK101_006692 [Irineochytrium annulatum]|nr:hypothetical protein HK101_006692 [Irineochytrium annulatum]